MGKKETFLFLASISEFDTSQLYRESLLYQFFEQIDLCKVIQR